jgi:predicted enzyme related to lactoylglutathione lyase
MAYNNLHFCWHGINTTDMDKAEAFYAKALGFDILKTPMGDSTATMITANGIPRAHIMPVPMEGMPSHWNNYLRVEDVDASAKIAVDNGGTLLVPGTDIPPGRFAFVTSPSGAAIALFRESGDDATNPPRDDMGAIHWVELHSTNLDADLAWLSSTFGLQAAKMEMTGDAAPPGGYYILSTGPDAPPTGGAMTSMAPEGTPASWLAWVSVDDVDACLERVKSQGGTAVTPAMDAPGVGRMAMIQDSTGAHFGIMTPSQDT